MFKFKLTEKHYAALILLAVIVLTYCFAPEDLNLQAVLILKVAKVGLFVGLITGLLIFLRGTSYDVLGAIFPSPYKQEIDEATGLLIDVVPDPVANAFHAIAVSVFIVGFAVAVALVIAQ